MNMKPAIYKSLSILKCNTIICDDMNNLEDFIQGIGFFPFI